MFLLIGLGERGGSGMPKIFSGWRDSHWRQPLLREKMEPEQTLLELHMLDLMPETILDSMRARLGAAYEQLDVLGRLILATAFIEGVVNHGRMTEICNEHAYDISQTLARLERLGLLMSHGQSRGKVYFVPGSAPVSAEQVFFEMVELPPTRSSFGSKPSSSGSNTASSGSNVATSGSGLGHSLDDAAGLASDRGDGTVALESVEAGRTASKVSRDSQGCLLSPLLDAPIVDDLSLLSPELTVELIGQAGPSRASRRLDRPTMARVMLAVCRGRYVRLSVLAELLQRDPDGLRKGYLDGLVKDQLIRRAFPSQPTHELQSYRTAASDRHGVAQQSS